MRQQSQEHAQSAGTGRSTPWGLQHILRSPKLSPNPGALVLAAGLPRGKTQPLQAAQWKMHLMASPRGEAFKGKAVLVSRCFVAPLSNPHVKYGGDWGWMGC